jgi:hypothetical protein
MRVVVVVVVDMGDTHLIRSRRIRETASGRLGVSDIHS